MEPHDQPEEEDFSVEIAEQADRVADAATEQDDVLTERWAEDDYQLKQELDREQSGVQIIAEAEIEHQEWLTGEEEKEWIAEHEKLDIEETEEGVNVQRVGPTQKTCTKCQKRFMQFFGSADSIGNYCNECGGLLIDTSEGFMKEEAARAILKMPLGDASFDRIPSQPEFYKVMKNEEFSRLSENTDIRIPIEQAERPEHNFIGPEAKFLLGVAVVLFVVVTFIAGLAAIFTGALKY